MTVSVDAVVYYRVNNATISIANVEDANGLHQTAGPDNPEECPGYQEPCRDLIRP